MVLVAAMQAQRVPLADAEPRAVAAATDNAMTAMGMEVMMATAVARVAAAAAMVGAEQVAAVVEADAVAATNSSLRRRGRNSTLTLLSMRMREIVRRGESVVRQVRVDLRRREMFVAE